MKYRLFTDKLSGFVYRWTNQLNGMMYIGSHNGRKKNYIGSGLLFQRAVKKHGIENFTREILYDGFDFRQKEDEWLVKVDAANSPLYYNLKNEALGGTFIGEKNGMFGKKLTDEERFICGSAFRGKKRPAHSEQMKGENNPRFGKSEHSHGIVTNAKARKGKSNVEVFGELKAAEISMKISLAHRGKQRPHRSQEWIENQRASQLKTCEIHKQQKFSQIQQEEQACKVLYETGLTIKQVAHRLSLSMNVAYHRIRSAGTVMRPRTRKS